MAVYTVLQAEEIRALLAAFDIGPLVAAEGIAAGIENSNYLLVTAPGGCPSPTHEYVLTIAESQNFEDIEFIAALTTRLRQHGLAVPAPVRTRTGTAVLRVRGKAAVLMPKIAGEHPLNPGPAQCRAAGAALGRLHQITLASGLAHASHRSLAWVKSTARTVTPTLTPAEQHLLAAELDNLDKLAGIRAGLPQAIIHGDLFRDNTLFQGEHLTGIIDFFSAGTGFLLFDLAVAVNDWCSLPDGALLRERYLSLLDGYQHVRPLQTAEKDLWPNFLRLAALRFWVSRLGETLARPQTAKDAGEYRRILELRGRQPVHWPG